MDRKLHDGAIVAGTSIFSALFFMISVYWLRQSTALNKVKWDVETVTAADYTVEMDVTRHFDRFKNSSDNRAGEAVGYGFKHFLINELENLLTNQVPYQGYERVNRIRIADM